MQFVETERRGQVMVVRMNRPERLNALGQQIRAGLADAWREFRDSEDLEVAVLTGTGRAFCAGEDMKESVERGAAGDERDADDPFMTGTLQKPVIAAVNGFAMGGGFQLVERTDLRVAVHGAIFEISGTIPPTATGYPPSIPLRAPRCQTIAGRRRTRVRRTLIPSEAS
jgi:enoyl-CoA hydratase/carnithine racemase